MLCIGLSEQATHRYWTNERTRTKSSWGLFFNPQSYSHHLQFLNGYTREAEKLSSTLHCVRPKLLLWKFGYSLNQCLPTELSREHKS